MFTITLSHTALAFATAVLFLMDPSRALQGRVNGPYTEAISARAQSGEDILLNHTTSAPGQAVVSSGDADRDFGARALLAQSEAR